MSTGRQRVWWGLVLSMAVAAVSVTVAAEPGRDPLRFRKLSWDEMAAQPDGPRKLERELTRQRVYHERWRAVHDMLGAQHMSRKSARYLAGRGLGPARVTDPLAGAGKAERTTLRVLLVRISFDGNREPDLATMAPDGDFFMEPRDPDAVLQIDPEPHNKAFFEAHLEGLEAFYQDQSGGRLDIDWTVLPPGENDSYKIRDIADSGPGADGYWFPLLEPLVREMVAAADEGAAADGVSLADYDDDNDLAYVIFAHAGSDWQSDINQDSPNDIPTFFITFGEPMALNSVDSETGAVGSFSECSVIPETTTQDGYKGSIAAALFHEFGHALGLPDVYDAYSGYTACGIWDLMDSGTNLAANLGYVNPETGQLEAESVTGVLPPSLSAWCKWFLGWVTTDVVTGGEGQDVLLPAVGVLERQYALHDEVAGNHFGEAGAQVLIGGASPQEFFLVENRWVPWFDWETPYDNYDDGGTPDDPSDDWGGLYLHRDPDTGVVQWLAGDRDGVAGWNTGYYDFFLPDGGVLVWHANMDRIEEGLADNTINRYGDGLRVVEADGIQDIGVFGAYVLGWYGSVADVFAPWNTEGYDQILPGGAGVPTSLAYDRSWTGLKIWDIADDGEAHGAVMRMRAAVEPLVEGWPVFLPSDGTADVPEPRALDVATVTPLTTIDGDRVLIAASPATETGQAALLAWTMTGEPAFLSVPDLGAAVFYALEDTHDVVDPPCVWYDTSGDPRLTFCTSDGDLTTVIPTAIGAEPGIVELVSGEDSSWLAGPQPVYVDGLDEPLFFCIDGGGTGRIVDTSGAAIDDLPELLSTGGNRTSAPLRMIAGPGGDARVLVVAPDQFRVVRIDAAGVVGTTVGRSMHVLGQAHVAVVPGDDSQRIIIYHDGGLLGSWLLTDAGDLELSEWPDLDESLVCEPAVADLDGDGRLDVVVATATKIHAWQDNGTILTGYPRTLHNLFPLEETTLIGGSLVVADLAAGPANELALLTDDGHLVVLGQDALPIAGTPLRCGQSEGALAFVPHDGTASLAVAGRGGRRGEPLGQRITHGSVALYGHHQPEPSLTGTAGWYGPGGGPMRVGPVGTLSVVDDAETPGSQAPEVVYYPMPLTDAELNVRFFSATSREAKLMIYDLAGESVVECRLTADADRINAPPPIPFDVASGFYIAHLLYEPVAGQVVDDVQTLAVAR